MTVTPDTATARGSLADTFAIYLKARVLVVLFLGFSAGLPLALSSSTLLVWVREARVDLCVIGLFALVSTPYTIKFLWSPVVDALDIPVLSPLFGRRRAWLFFSQLLLILSIILLAFCDPALSPWYVVFAAAAFVATASATQDIVIDAFRIESLSESEQAAGMAAYVAAYRLGMLASTAGALFLVSGFEAGLGFGKDASWTAGYLVMAALVVVGIATMLIARVYPLVTSLWIGAFLQMASNLIFTWQAFVGVNLWALTVTIIVENFTGAIGTVIFVAYLSALCNNPLHTATQYALLTALAAVGRTYLSAGAGFIAERTGWPLFFIISALTALPSLVLLVWLQRRG